MNPALSVVAFTVLSGAGLGALALIALFDVVRLVASPTLPAEALSRAAIVALALVVAGLCASTLHLGNPRNAWRSLARLRSSWLSREAAAALVLLPFATLWVGALAFDAFGAARGFLALVVIGCAWVTLYCTAMIYASLKPIRAWYTQRVPIVFVALGHASGALVVVAALRIYGSDAAWPVAVTVVLFVVAALAKLDYYAYLAGPNGRLTIEQAIGVPQGVAPAGAMGASRMRARLLDAGHTRGTFLTREFGFVLTPARRTTLRALVWIAGFAVPVLWLVAGTHDGAIAACLVCLAGLLAERWLFFAEARHTVRLYHGDRST